MKQGSGVLIFGAAMSFFVALLHVAMAAVGVDAYIFFTVPARFVELARRGSFVPPLVACIIALVFVFFGMYAWSAAGRRPRLPQPRIALIAICTIYMLRGLVVVPELLLFLNTPDIPLRALGFSLLALAMGIVYTVGTALRWPALPTA